MPDSATRDLDHRGREEGNGGAQVTGELGDLCAGTGLTVGVERGSPGLPGQCGEASTIG